MAALGVQRVRGQQHVGQVDPIQQRDECGELVGLPVHLGLPEHNPGCGIERGQQMHLTFVGAAPWVVFPSTATTRIRPGGGSSTA